MTVTMMIEESVKNDQNGKDIEKYRRESSDSMDIPTLSESDNKKQGAIASLLRYPKGVFFCLGNEFSERFSYYGMTAILTLYLSKVHGMSDSMAALIFHAFHFVAYFSPILGSIAADGFLGRYKVIVYVSFFYCFGHLLITLGAIDAIDFSSRRIMDLVGLFVVGLATGGIKPCVVSFAADQFPNTMLKEREQFFSFFYFSINLGAFLSMILTPIFRTQISYAVAFGVPAIFMGLALAIFLCGRPYYKIVDCKENVIWNVTKCTASGLVKTIKNRGPPIKGTHWLDHSIPAYGLQMVEDIKTIFSIMLLYVPVIFFWALFDQQGSTWVLQANRMNGRLGVLTIIPEQMGFLNPFFIITLIPLFVRFLYPVLTSRNILVKPLQRMTCGGILAAISFFIAGFIQLKINATMVSMPDYGQAKYTFMNLAGCNIKIEDFQLNNGQTMTKHLNLPTHGGQQSLPNFQYENCSNQHYPVYKSDENYTMKNDFGQLVVFWNSTKRALIQTPFDLEKTEDSNAKLYPVFHPFYEKFHNVSLLAKQNDDSNVIKYTVYKGMAEETEKNNYIVLRPSSAWSSHKFELWLEICIDDVICNTSLLRYYETSPGEAYALVITENVTAVFQNLIPPNTVHIAWQVPQYLIITIGEMFFSISGLEFSYSQAAPSMKSVLQAIWLMTVAFGNVVDIIISGSGTIHNKAVEFFFYACLMFAVMLIFAFLAKRYKYVDKDHEETYETVKKNSS